MRIGHGFDVHKLVKGRRLVLGGVEIPFDKGLLGHSDADVLIHAAMDAVLGALGTDDIGTHFPDTEPAYKDISSMLLLEKVVATMRAAKYHLGNIDVLLHADQPKVKEYIPSMRANIARAFECHEQRINVKATTWEGIGFAGEGQGMAASAVCIIVPDMWDEDSDEIPFAALHLFDELYASDTHAVPAPAKPGKSGDKKAKATGTKPVKQVGRKPRVTKSKACIANIAGASKGNPGPAAVGVIVRDTDGVIIAEFGEAIGEATNNVAEYRALIRALEECRLLKAGQVIIRTDSQLMARQIDGSYKVKSEQLRDLYDRALELLAGFEAFEVAHIPRAENMEADKLANSALDKRKK